MELEKDRRKHPRLEMDLPVTLRYKGRFIPATAKNISVGGMALSTDDPSVTEDGPVEVVADRSYELKDVALCGTILRVSGGPEKIIAVQFSKPHSLSHQTLERFIQSRLS